MRKIRRLFVIALLFIYCNFTYFCVSMPAPGFTWLLAGILGTIFYLCCHIIPGRMCGKTVRGLSPRLQALIGGVELIMAVAVCSIGEVIFYIVIWKNTAAGLLVLNGILAMLFLFFLMGNGIVRVFLTTKQIGILSKIIYLLLWWVPILNLFFVARMWRAARFEYEVERNLLEMNAARQENTVCHTRYPIIMVHGIFFRDWQFMNYWGRIPAQLKKNGAEVYYGKQQSAIPVSKSAEELKQHILQICEETGCEKVNIIAHSKGGLDARYAISCLGMAPYVATLTTINTPHRGCRWVDEILAAFPDSLVRFVAKRYNSTINEQI